MTHNPVDLIRRFGEKYKQVEELKFISEYWDDLEINLIDGLGLLNYIYLVQTPDKSKSIILKYGEEKAASSNLKDHHLTMERQLLEYNCLKLVDELCPGGVPKPYVYDKDMQIGEVSLHLASELGRIMGCFHFKTHRKVVSAETWQEYKHTLNKKKMVQMLLGMVLETIEKFNGEESYIAPLDEKRFREMQSEIISNRLYEPIRNLFVKDDCFGHLDCTALSVMVSNNRCSFIDFEFGGLCSHSFTLAKMMTSYYFALHDIRNKMEDKKELLRLTKQAIRTIVDAFLHEFGEMVHILGPLEEFFADMAVLSGHFLFLMSLVVSTARDCMFRATDESIRRLTEKGFYIIKNHREITSMDKFIYVLFDEN